MRLLILIFLFFGLFAQNREDVYNLYRIEGRSICLKFGLPDTCWKDVRIEIVDDFSRINSSWGLVPDWSAGVAIPSENMIVLLASSNPERFSTVALHELVHIVVHKRLAGVSIPRWFDEGVAQILSEQWQTQKSATLAWAVLWRRIIPLERLEYVNSMAWIKAELSYAESYNAIVFLTKELNINISQLLDSVVVAGDFEEGFHRATGMTLQEFYFRWSKQLFKWYLPFVLLGDQRFLWVMLTVVFVILGIAKIVRYRTKMKRIRVQEVDEYEYEVNDDFDWYTDDSHHIED